MFSLLLEYFLLRPPWCQCYCVPNPCRRVGGVTFISWLSLCSLQTWGNKPGSYLPHQLIFFSLFNIKLPTMTLYGARPDSLIYHNHEFHIQDIVVTVKNNRKDNLRCNVFRQISCFPLIFNLELLLIYSQFLLKFKSHN